MKKNKYQPFILLLSAAVLLISFFCAKPADAAQLCFADAIPDNALRTAIMKEVNAESETELLTDYAAELAALDSLSVPNLGIKSMDGLSYLPALRFLDCGQNALTKLNVSMLGGLTDLFCGENALTKLDLSQNRSLICVDCSNNQISTITLPAGNSLEYLDISANKLTTVDTSEAVGLRVLNSHDNQLSGLSLVKNTALNALYTDNNQLKSIDLSHNSALSVVDLGSQNAVAQVKRNEDGTYTFLIEPTGSVTNVSDGVFYGNGVFTLSSDQLDELLSYRYVPNGGFVMDVTIITAGGTSNEQPATPDLNNDKIVNAADLTILLSNYGKSGTGDINGDGTINAADLTILLSNYGK